MMNILILTTLILGFEIYEARRPVSTLFVKLHIQMKIQTDQFGFGVTLKSKMLVSIWGKGWGVFSLVQEI